MKRMMGLSLVALAACANEGSAEADPTTDPPEDDSSTTDPTDGPALGMCHELPAATAAQWDEGETLTSEAVSTPERIAAAGERTWPLALQLLRVTDPAQHASVAHSPTAMVMSLGMSHMRWPGADCGDSIRTTIGWAEDGAALHETLGATLTTLVARALPAAESSDPVVVGLHPSTWEIGEPGTAGSSEVQRIFGGTQHVVSKEGDGALAAINEVMNCVIEEQSQGLLVDFLPDGQPAGDTTSYDLTVAFLQAPWAVTLYEDDPLAFTKDGGEAVELPAFFGSVSEGRYYSDASFVAVDVPLRGSELIVQLVLPQAEAHADLAAFVASVTAEQLAAARSGAEYGAVELTMPKVTIDSTTIDYYEPLGLDCALFTMRKVLHGASVAIDHKGVRAAAASADEGWESGSGEGETIATVKLDRPFLFFVYDAQTSNVLYSGRFAG